MRILTFQLGSNPDANLVCYLRGNGYQMGKAPAVLLCPGGAYMGLSEGEGEPLAMSFLARGYHAFVLHYSVGLKCVWPQTLVEAGMAIKMIRDHAVEWGVDADAIAIGGFSAGGHVAATAGTMWNDPAIQKAIGAVGEENKPNAMLLFYPCINIDMPAIENGELVLKIVSAAEHVGAHTPPAFVAHTYEDAMVSMEQSLQMVTAMSKADRPLEYHVYTPGGHASLHETINRSSELGEHVPNYYDVFDRCCEWLKDRFGYPKPPMAFMPPADNDGPRPFSVRRHMDTLECMVTGSLFAPPMKGSGITPMSKLGDLAANPKAMEVLYKYVPQLRDLKLNELSLGTSLSTWLGYAGYKTGNPFMQTPGDPEVDAFMAEINAIIG